jgi:hypothetical protein
LTQHGEGVELEAVVGATIAFLPNGDYEYEITVEDDDVVVPSDDETGEADAKTGIVTQEFDFGGEVDGGAGAESSDAPASAVPPLSGKKRPVTSSAPESPVTLTVELVDPTSSAGGWSLELTGQ